jgi:hypothetical protein
MDDGEITVITPFIRLVTLYSTILSRTRHDRPSTTTEFVTNCSPRREHGCADTCMALGLPRSPLRALHSGPVCDGCDDWG